MPRSPGFRFRPGPSTPRHCARAARAPSASSGRSASRPATKEAALSPVTDIFAVAGADGAIRLWDLRSRNRVDGAAHGPAPAHGPRRGRAGARLLARRRRCSPPPTWTASCTCGTCRRATRCRSSSATTSRSGRSRSRRTARRSPPARSTRTCACSTWGRRSRARPGASCVRQPTGVTALAWTGGGEWILTGHSSKVLRLTDPHRCTPARHAARPRGARQPAGAVAGRAARRGLEPRPHHPALRPRDARAGRPARGAQAPGHLAVLPGGRRLPGERLPGQLRAALGPRDRARSRPRCGARPTRASCRSRSSASRTTSRWPSPTAASASGARAESSGVLRRTPDPPSATREYRSPAPCVLAPDRYAGVNPAPLAPVLLRALPTYDSCMSDAREFHDGQKDGVALESLDLDKVKSFGPAAGHVADRVQRPLARRGARRDRGDGEGPRLQGGAHALGRHDHRQDGQGHLQDDRHRHGARGGLHRRADGARHVRGGRPHPLPPRPDDDGRGALRQGLQPRLRHARDGGEPQLRRGVHLEGARPPRPRARAVERDRQPHARRGAGRGPARQRASCGAPTSRRSRSTSRPSPTPSSASTSRPGP